jgi:hypothetical protein
MSNQQETKSLNKGLNKVGSSETTREKSFFFN